MVEEYCTGTVRIYFYLFEHLQFTVTYSFYGLQIYSLRTVTVTVRVCTVYLYILHVHPGTTAKKVQPFLS